MTLVVNLYGGPGCGKSTSAAYIFSQLKMRNKVRAELVTEFAKDLTWEERHNALENQPYILGEQYRRMARLVDKVDVIITDSPLMLSAVYNTGVEELNALAYALYKGFSNLDVWLIRSKPYNKFGRGGCLKVATDIDDRTKLMLKRYDIVALHCPTAQESLDDLVVAIEGYFKETECTK